VSKEIKVTDKRMFTPEGELREEYRDLLEKAKTEPEPAMAQDAALRPEPSPAASPPASEAPRGRGGRRTALEPEPEPEAMPFDFPSTPPGLGPGFFDLAAMLAEPAALYLGDVPLPDGQTAEDLEMARMHIDLLDVLRQKTIGNLTAQESAFLEDLLYRLRVRYVQKHG
jgi:hypothetical protein